MIRGILLRPTDPSIFEPDSCGGRPPTAMWTGRDWLAGPVTVAGANGWPMAVALAWDGEVLQFGIAAFMVLDDCFNPNHLLLDMLAIIRGDDPERVALKLESLREYLEEYSHGEIVLVDEHGREIE